jgi:hypothetical protein
MGNAFSVRQTIGIMFGGAATAATPLMKHSKRWTGEMEIEAG